MLQRTAAQHLLHSRRLRIAQMRQDLARLMREAGLTDDRMPLDEGIKQALPDLKIR